MADRKRYYDDPNLARLETVVIEAGEEAGRPWVRLEETLFYPEGGGQPADRGTIGGVPVLDVLARGEKIVHFVERPVPAGPTSVAIDAALRFDRMQQHTAQHLLTSLLADRYELPTTAFHLGERYTAIEVPGKVPPADRLLAFEEEANQEIRRDRRVTARWVSPETFASLPVRTRGLPEGHEGDIRLVEIETLDLNTCGGTHVARLGEIQMLRIVDAEAARGQARIRFLAGGRVLRELREAAALEAALKARIGTAREEFASVIEGWQTERKLSARRVLRLEREIGGRIAAEMARESGPRLTRFVPDAGADLLREIATALVALRPDAVAVLAGAPAEGGEASLLVQAGPDGPGDVSGIGRALAERLGAKGGGKGRTFQGRGGRWPGKREILDVP
jgi:alanyl-tRNA synthetase